MVEASSGLVNVRALKSVDMGTTQCVHEREHEREHQGMKHELEMYAHLRATARAYPKKQSWKKIWNHPVFMADSESLPVHLSVWPPRLP